MGMVCVCACACGRPGLLVIAGARLRLSQPLDKGLRGHHLRGEHRGLVAVLVGVCARLRRM
jgi:hypothetical protein